MCLIIHKPDATSVIPADYIDNAEDKNPDGFGIVYLDNNEHITTMDYTYARMLIEQDRPLVAHYRYATKGPVNIGNCHPFVIEQDGDHMLFSNGTVSTLGSSTKCDTLVVAEILEATPKKYWGKCLAFTDTRFAIVDPDSNVERYGKWHERDGIYYSKADCFYFWNPKGNKVRGYYSTSYSSTTKNTSAWDESYLKTRYENDVDDVPVEDDIYSGFYTDTFWAGNHKIAVYGTLKAGHGNHRLLEDAEFVGAGKTQDKYPLQKVGNLPYVFNKPHTGENVTVEIYDLTTATQRAVIDNLEGHPWHYKRKQISIDMANGTEQKAWLYFAESVTYNHQDQMLCSY